MPLSFSSLPVPAQDAIFAVAARARAAGAEAIDGTIGMYLDEEGKPLLLPSVRAALKDIAETLPDRSYAYTPLTGVPAYRRAVTQLIFGEDSRVSVASIASTGGTGAVALNLRLASVLDPETTVILPVPTWANHARLIHAAGLPTVEVPGFLDGLPSIDGMVEAMERHKGSCTVLLQVGCHNPSGIDYSLTQWESLAERLLKHRALAILDFAYQGFGSSPEKDADPVRLFVERGVTTLVCWSGAKNHSIYCERAGCSLAVVPDEAMRKCVEDHYSILSRGMQSASAAFGQIVVARVQEYHANAWRRDLAGCRELLTRKRGVLATALPQSLRRAVQGSGMFALLPLRPEEIDSLEREHKVFMTGDGRINIAGIPLARMEELAEKIRTVRQG